MDQPTISLFYADRRATNVASLLLCDFSMKMPAYIRKINTQYCVLCSTLLYTNVARVSLECFNAAVEKFAVVFQRYAYIGISR